MKKSLIFCFLLCFVYCFSYSQNKKSVITISPSFSYRGRQIELSNYYTRRIKPAYSYEFPQQFDVKSFGLDFSSTFLKDKLGIALSTYFRYGHLYYDESLRKEVKSLKSDFMLDLLYNFNFNSKNSFKFSIGGGIGKINVGTNFRYAFIPDVDAAGRPYLREGSGSFAFNGARFIFKISKQRWNFSVSALGCPDMDNNPNLSLSIEPKISYNLYSFKIASKKMSN